jgi:hypothetical protein
MRRRSWFFTGWFLAKHGDNIFDRYYIELVVGLKIDRDGVFGVEDNLVILP